MTRVIVLAALALAWTAMAGAQQMPNPREMSGVPLPAGDVPNGTVTVRVLRGSFANPVVSQTVEILGTPEPRRAVTNEAGRAEFSGLPGGTRVKAAAMVGSERLESQEFEVPARGGVRLMLVAADPGSPAAGAGGDEASPARPGEVRIGEESRFVFEMGEDGLSVFYILQIVNSASTPVAPSEPLIFRLPAEARGATVLEGSSAQAAVAGRELKVQGPFAPGPTLVQLGYTMPISGPELVVEQELPAPLAHLAVVAQKVGEMQLASPQIAEQRTMPAQGNLYIAGRGGPMQAGEVLRFQFSGLPHHPTWPRNVALGLAAVILVAGVFVALRRAPMRVSQAAGRRELEGRRDRLFDELAALETRYRDGAVDPERYAERRRELIAALERVYVALDEEVAVGRAS